MPMLRWHHQTGVWLHVWPVTTHRTRGARVFQRRECWGAGECSAGEGVWFQRRTLRPRPLMCVCDATRCFLALEGTSSNFIANSHAYPWACPVTVASALCLAAPFAASSASRETENRGPALCAYPSA